MRSGTCFSVVAEKDGSVQMPGARPAQTAAGQQPASSAVRPSKRALVRKAATRVISFLFRRSGRSQPTAVDRPGAGTEGAGTAEMWPGASGSPLPASARMPRLQSPESDAQSESARVFDLLNKYSQRHSNGSATVYGTLTTTISDSSERKPLQKSKYADVWSAQDNIPEPEQVRKSKSGKLLQKSKYADVWSAQDQLRPDGGAQRATTKTATRSVTGTQSVPSRPGTGTKPVSGRPGYYAKPLPSAASQGSAPTDQPPSRLEQLMNRSWPFYPFAEAAGGKRVADGFSSLAER